MKHIIVRNLFLNYYMLLFSMDECEALCDRLTIMVGGKMKCIGTIQNLKQVYSKGFTILVKLKSVEEFRSKLDTFKKLIITEFGSSCKLQDEHKVNI